MLIDTGRFEALLRGSGPIIFGASFGLLVVAIDGDVSAARLIVVGNKDRYTSLSVHGPVDRGLVLGQRQVGENPTRSPRLLGIFDVLDIKGSIITLDAMGCQA